MFRITGKENLFSQNRSDNDGKKYRLEDFYMYAMFLFARVREDDQNRYSWAHLKSRTRRHADKYWIRPKLIALRKPF